MQTETELTPQAAERVDSGAGEGRKRQARSGSTRFSGSRRRWLVERERQRQTPGHKSGSNGATIYRVLAPGGNREPVYETDEPVELLQFLTTGAEHRDRRFTRRDFPGLFQLFYDSNLVSFEHGEENERAVRDYLKHWRGWTEKDCTRALAKDGRYASGFVVLLRHAFYATLTRLQRERKNYLRNIRATAFPGWLFERCDFSCFAPLDEAYTAEQERGWAADAAASLDLNSADLRAVIRETVLRRVARYEGNVMAAARSLGLTRRGLQKILDRYGERPSRLRAALLEKTEPEAEPMDVLCYEEAAAK